MELYYLALAEFILEPRVESPCIDGEAVPDKMLKVALLGALVCLRTGARICSCAPSFAFEGTVRAGAFTPGVISLGN